MSWTLLSKQIQRNRRGSIEGRGSSWYTEFNSDSLWELFRLDELILLRLDFGLVGEGVIAGNMDERRFATTVAQLLTFLMMKPLTKDRRDGR